MVGVRDTHYVELVQPLSDLAQLVFVLFVVQRSPLRLDGLELFRLAILWHKQGRARHKLCVVFKGLTLDDALLEG